jgi:hypothetical protein
MDIIWWVILHIYKTTQSRIRDVNVEVETRGHVIWKMLNRPKKLNANQYKKYCYQFFSPICPLLHLCLSCDIETHFGSMLCMLWILRVCNMSLDKLCYLWNIHNMECYECRMYPGMNHCVFRKYEWGKRQTRGKNCCNTFVPTAFNFFFLF